MITFKVKKASSAQNGGLPTIYILPGSISYPVAIFHDNTEHCLSGAPSCAEGGWGTGSGNILTRVRPTVVSNHLDATQEMSVGR